MCKRAVIVLLGLAGGCAAAPPSRAIHWLAVHGDRHARLLALAAGGGRGPALAPACEVVPRTAWTLDALLCGGQGAGGTQPCLLAVGDSDNAVTVFALPAAALAAAAAVAVAAGADAQVSLLPPAGPLATPVLRAACSERSLLFSMSLVDRAEARNSSQFSHILHTRKSLVGLEPLLESSPPLTHSHTPHSHTHSPPPAVLAHHRPVGGGRHSVSGRPGVAGAAGGAAGRGRCRR